MPTARKHLVCPQDTPYYHVMSRCVRRAFLCGQDAVTGRDYEHRRDWIEHRLRILCSVFSIEVCAYAIMINHYHLVVRLNADNTNAWSEREVLERWTTLFKGPLIVQRYCNQQPLSTAQRATVSDLVKVYRHRLGSLSWFMKCLNEPIARQANAEDRCTGHFWESRFVSQALRSEQALIGAMAYVDLNPVRAGMAVSPEASEYTSVYARVHPKRISAQLSRAIAALIDNGSIHRTPSQIRPLAAFADQAPKQLSGPCLPIRWSDYIELVDTTGRIAVLGKRGHIDPSISPVLERLSMTSEQWLEASTNFRQFYRAQRRDHKNVA